MDKEVRVSLLIKMINNSFKRKLDSKLIDVGLTASQCAVLGFINDRYDFDRTQEINPIDIERHFNLKRPTVTGILKRLEEKELIKFKPSAKDNRYKQIILTSKSRELHEELVENLNNAEKILTNNLFDKDIAKLREFLFIMLKNMTD